MSISNLLNPLVQNEQWSNLYCNQLNSNTIISPSVMNTIFNPPNIVFTVINPSTGTNLYQTVYQSQYTSNGHTYQQLDFGLTFGTNVLGAFLPNNGNSLFSIGISGLPNISNPIFLQRLPGSCNAFCITNIGTIDVCSCFIILETINTISILTVVGGDISTVNNNRYIYLSGTIKYIIS